MSDEKKTLKDTFKSLLTEENIKVLDEILMFTAKDMNVTHEDVKYVIWVDIMGAGDTMRDSMHRAINIIARLHLSIKHAESLLNADELIEKIPVNDGCFIITKNKKTVNKIISTLMFLMGYYFIKRNNPWERFPIRISVSYGPVLSNYQLYKKINSENIKNLPDYAFGPSIIQAYESENKSPPFGVYVHESARAFCNQGESVYTGKYYRWWNDPEQKNAINLSEYGKHKINLSVFKEILSPILDSQFDWMIKNPHLSGVDIEKAKLYQNHFKQYFAF